MDNTDRGDNTSPNDFLQRLKTLATTHVAGNNQLLARFGALVQQATQSANAADPGKTDAQALLSRWLEFNLRSYSVMMTNSLSLFNGLLSAAESALILKPIPSATAASAAPSTVQLRLSGQRGERATAGFIVENKFDRALNVTLECDDLTPQTGPVLSNSHVNLEPNSIEIGPHSEAVVQMAVSITDDFIIGQTYLTTIRLLGSENKAVKVAVAVLSTPDADKPQTPASKRRKSSQRRARR